MNSDEQIESFGYLKNSHWLFGVQQFLNIKHLKIFILLNLNNSYILMPYINKGAIWCTPSFFLNNRTQAVRIPAEFRFDDNIKQAMIRKVGNERILTPMDSVWDSFFLSDERASDDFMTNRPIAPRSERLSFDNDEWKNWTLWCGGLFAYWTRHSRLFRCCF